MADELFYNRALETLDRGSLKLHQDARLRQLLGEIAGNQFYAAKFREAGISAQEIKTTDDLCALSFTSKSELVEEQLAHPPFGRLATYPLSRYPYFHQTSGTTGRPLKWLDTRESWDCWTRCWGYVYRGAGVAEDDTVFCAFSFGPYMSHWAAISGAWHIGATAISGGGMNSEQRLRMILDNQCTVLACTPTYALHLAEAARALGIDLRSGPVRVSIHAGEPGASLANVRRSIEGAWGSTCFDHAGATEAGAWAFACQRAPGAMHLNEAEFIFEVIDSRTGEQMEEGRRGELVITNLDRAGMPVLRYRTGDLVEMTSAACGCGRTFARINGGVLGRADDMLIVRGVNLYPAAIDDLMHSLPHIAEYEVNITRVAGMDDLLFRIEAVETGNFAEVAQLAKAAFRREFNIRVSIEEAAPGSLPRYEFKARRYKRTTLET